MAIGSWKAPFPLKFGGGTRSEIGSIYNMIRANRPEVLRSSASDSDVEIENRAIARMMACAKRAIQRRVSQRDPLKMSEAVRAVTAPDGMIEDLSPLERWERFLGLRPATDATLHERRGAVKGKLVATTSANRTAVENAVRAVTGDWFHSIHENSVDDVHYAGRSPAGSVHAYWADSGFTFSADYPGEYNASWPWTTGLAVIGVYLDPPASVDTATIRATIARVLDTLDDILPAWMSATVSIVTPGVSTTGFFLDLSSLDLTAL